MAHILKVPFTGTGLKTVDAFIPDLPIDILKSKDWGIAGKGNRIWVNCDQAKCDEICLRPGATLIHQASAQELQEFGHTRAAMFSEAAPDPGKPFSARDEQISYYREKVIPLESADANKGVTLNSILNMIAILGTSAAAFHISALLGCTFMVAMLYVQQLTTYHSDGFSGLLNLLEVRGAMDGAGGGTAGTWAKALGALSVDGSGHVGCSGAQSHYYDSAQSSTNVMRASYLTNGGSGGPMAATQTNGDGVLSYARPGINDIQWFTYVGGSGFTSLGHPGNNCNVGDLIGVEDASNSYTLLLNSSVISGPSTPGLFTGGVGGCYGDSAATNQGDGWYSETNASSTAKRSRSMSFIN